VLMCGGQHPAGNDLSGALNRQGAFSGRLPPHRISGEGWI